MIRAALLVLCLSLPATAQTVVSPQEFERLSAGKTLHFFRRGSYFGSEQFFANRQSVWKYGSGSDDCLDGTWFSQGSLICFSYSESPTPECWQVFKDGGNIFFRGEGQTGGADIDLGYIDATPLQCTGPELGV